MQTAIMSRRSYSVNSSNKTSKRPTERIIERQCSMYGVCMYVWVDGCTVCMCVHVSVNICVCVCTMHSQQCPR